MSEKSPTIYLLYGDDEFGIESFLRHKLKPKMGSGANADLNISSLDGRSKGLEEIQSETHALPFLTERRMVIIDHPLAAAKGKTNQSKFLTLLESLPQTTACVLLVPRKLSQDHWLIQWADQHPDLIWKKGFFHRQGQALIRWIQEQAQAIGGEFDPQAAGLLASYLDDNPRLAAQEIEKLVIYVNFERPVTGEDVQNLTADIRQGDVFAMVDAVGQGDGKTASRMLHRLLDENDPLRLFGMIVRQFRLLIRVREALNDDPSSGHEKIARRLGEHPYPIKKIIPQARQFNLAQLKQIYSQLTEVDHAIKTGKLTSDLALDLLIAALTDQTQTEKEYA